MPTAIAPVTVPRPENVRWDATLAANLSLRLPPNAAQTGIAMQPFGAYAWHDILAFNRNATPTFESSADGTTFAADALDTSRLFAMKDDQAYQVIDGTTKVAARWTWNGSQLPFSYGQWLSVGVTYTATSPNITVLWESSSDGSTWTTRHTSTVNDVAAIAAWCYVGDYVGGNYRRLTLAVTNGQPLSLTSIRLLSSRLGNQGRGREIEFPYVWDHNARIGIGVPYGSSLSANLVVGTTSDTTAAAGVLLGDASLYRSAANTITSSATFRADNFVATGGAGGRFTRSGATAVADWTLASSLALDTVTRYVIRADGQQEWGDGTNTRDTNLYRAAANLLQTDDSFHAVGGVRASDGSIGYFERYNAASTGTWAFVTRVAGDTQRRFVLAADGGMYWGPGGSTAVDTSLSRSAVGRLVTNGSFQIGGTLGIGVAPSADRVVWVGSALAEPTSFGIVFDPTMNSTVTTAAYGIWARVKTAAASFTLPAAVGLMVNGPSLGAGSAITSNYGIRIGSQNPVGVANSWGIYFDGTGTGNDINWAGDTNLYRSAANVLKTDDAFQAVSIAGGTNPAQSGELRMSNSGALMIRNSGNTADLRLMQNVSAVLTIGAPSFSRIHFDNTALSVGTSNVASAGAIRLGNDQAIMWRNAANNADAGSVTLNSSSYLNVSGSSGVSLLSGSTTVVTFGATNAIFADGVNLMMGSSTGTKIGTSGLEKLGFWGVTPKVQSTGWGGIAVNDTRGVDVTSPDLNEVANTLNTLIITLISYGLLDGIVGIPP